VVPCYSVAIFDENKGEGCRGAGSRCAGRVAEGVACDLRVIGVDFGTYASFMVLLSIKDGEA